MKHKNNIWLTIFFAWTVSVIATLGSLFFSDIMEFPPCTMCWYQRICMYPLTLIFLVSLVKNDKNVLFYAAPLTIIGWFWAFYHSLLIYDVIKEELTPCKLGVPCSVTYINWFGFIDIPTLSLIAFTLIGASLVIIYKKGFKI
ncbi:MAG: disulfide bond formation protein B [Campylobacteraceae bacterium]|jgi:disulfide bond formation protein DsbB|nr:disulfide bond formation protein B [Campylobacteraceae bacterium]